MPILTIALVIGVSRYQDPQIEDLPAAKSDAITFARALRNWGICESDILFFLDEEATFAAINAVIENLAKRKEPFKLVFYFCGHGHRTSPPVPHSYLLFHDSQIENGTCRNSLRLDFLIESMNKCNCTEFYIFIDSCHLRINTIIHPNLKMEIEGNSELSKSLFCILSSGIETSFEDVAGEYGYFTDSLLCSLAAIRLKGCSPALLSRMIRHLMEQRNLPFPEMYNIGTQKIDFFNSDIAMMRGVACASFQDFLIQNRKAVGCIVGPEGIGKTAFCQLLASAKYKTYLIELTNCNDEATLCSALMLKYHHLFTELPFLPSLEIIFKMISEKEPYNLILIDGFQFKNSKQFNRILGFIINLHMQVVFTAYHPLKPLADPEFQSLFQEWELPGLSYEEAKQFIGTHQAKINEKDCEMIFLASRGNPLKIQKSLMQYPSLGVLDREKEEVNKAICSIYSCGFYINEDLFCKVFNLSHQTLRNLEEIGLIYQSDGAYYPHDLLNEIAETEMIEYPLKNALEYWYLQTDELPSHCEAAKSLILILVCLGYETKAESYLERAFQLLVKEGRTHVPYLIDGADIFLKSSVFTRSALFLAESLIHFGKWEIAQKLLKIPSDDPLMRTQIKISSAHCLWKGGNYQESIDLTTTLIEKKKELHLLSQLYFHRGISHFLSGKWDGAKSDFSYIIKKVSDPIYLGFAKCMLGSVLGLRGIEISYSKELLQKGIHLLSQSPDQGAAWVGWNNLGELLWKIGEYRPSAFHLQRAFEIAMHCEDMNMKIEAIRNLLQLNWRMGGPFSREVNEMLVHCEDIDFSNLELFTKMQILNTLATVFLMRGEGHRAPKLIREALSLTIHNDEYHIYTLSNLALLFKVRGNEAKALFHFQRASDLATEIGNVLALRQIQYDYAFCKN